MSRESALNLTAIIAADANPDKLRSCLHALSRWVPSILVVQSRSDETVRKTALEFGCAILQGSSLNPEKLWQTGIGESTTPWNLLIRSNEIVTGQLRKSIVEKIAIRTEAPCAFPLPLTTVFLRKRMKYPLRWTGMAESRLIYSSATASGNIDKIQIVLHRFEGELIQYGEETLTEAFQYALKVAEFRAEPLSHSPQDSCALIKAGLGAAATILFKQHVLGKRFKEGFEGAVFTLADLTASLTGYLRYHEKYIRSGKELKEHPESVKNILLIKLREIGDNILATPLARNLKQCFPNASITLLTHSYALPVWENNPHLDELIGLSKSPESGEINDLVRRLNGVSIDLILSTHSNRLATELLAKINARHKTNSHYIGRNKNYDILTPESDYYRSSIERDLDCLRGIGFDPTDTRTELFLTDAEIQWARAHLQERGINLDKKIVVVHPTAAAEIREWGMDRFGQLLKGLSEQEGLQPLAICTEAEYPRVKILYQHVPELVILHQMTLRQMMAVIHESDLVVDNDSSPSHIATAFRVPAIALFSQAIREIFRPYDAIRDKHFVFYQDVDCRECKLDHCANRICMDFSVDEVLEQSLKFLSEAS